MVDIVITPHFWQTRWFQITVTLASLGMVGGTVWLLELRRIRRKIEILKRRQAVDVERARIARDLHDDIGASLTQTALQSQLAERNVSRQPERAAGHLQELFKTASRMTRTLDEIIWAVNPKHDTLDNFILFLGSHTQALAESAGSGRLSNDISEGPAGPSCYLHPRPIARHPHSSLGYQSRSLTK